MWALRGWGIPSPQPPLTAPKDVINMAQTSIHFQGVQGGSEEHNKRLKNSTTFITNYRAKMRIGSRIAKNPDLHLSPKTLKRKRAQDAGEGYSHP